MDHPLQALNQLSLENGKQYLQSYYIEEDKLMEIDSWLEREAYEKLYEPFSSLKLAELLIFFGQRTQNTVAYALGLKARGDALVQIGHYGAAIESLDEAGECFLHAGDESNWARSRISWMVARAWLGNVEDALCQGEQARALFARLEEPLWVCTIDNNIAIIYSYTGRYKEALELYEQMRATYMQLIEYESATVSRNIALVDLNQAINLSLEGDFEQAYTLQFRARERLHGLGETQLELIAEINIADLDYLQGYYGSALRRYYYILDTSLASSNDDSLMLVELKLVIANCLIKLNRAQEAQRLAGEAIALYQRFDTSLNTILALIIQANALAACNRIGQAIDSLTEAELLATSGHFEHQIVAVHLQKVELLLTMQETSAAYEQAILLRETCMRRKLVTYEVRAELVMATALFILSSGRDTRIDGAAQLCKQILRTAHRYNLQEATYKSYHLLGHIALLHGRAREAGRYYRAAIMQIERILDDLVYDLSPTFLSTAWTIYADTIKFYLMLQQGALAFSYLERARSMALRQYLQRVEHPEQTSPVHQEARLTLTRTQRELKDWQERYREYGILLSKIDTSVSTTVDQATLQTEFTRCENKVSELFERLSLYQEENLLPDRSRKSRRQRIKRVLHEAREEETFYTRQIQLAYFIQKEKLVIFILKDGQLTWRTLPDGMQRLETLLPFMHAHLQNGRWKQLAASQQRGIRFLLYELYTLLIAPVADLLTDAELLTIIPYGPLHSLPFHALFNGSHFLIEDVPIRYLPASTISAPRPPRSTGGSKAPILFGYSAHGQLQQVSEEIVALTDILQGTSYLEEEATIARLRQEAPGSPIMHIATHGQHRLDAPNFSSVLLADGKLNAIDVFNLDLRGCELVTLSGCDTGLSMSTGGDEQLGLGRAFLAAGVETLVMSLWSVEDQITSKLMNYFYRALLEGESKVQALRTAQCLLLADADPAYLHPYYWAPFRLVGAIAPLRWKISTRI